MLSVVVMCSSESRFYVSAFTPNRVGASELTRRREAMREALDLRVDDAHAEAEAFFEPRGER